MSAVAVKGDLRVSIGGRRESRLVVSEMRNITSQANNAASDEMGKFR